MELTYALKTLWLKRLWAFAAVAVAVLAATSVLYRISVLPPGLENRSVSYGVASAEILLDAPSSTLGDLGRDILPLTERGGIFARVMTSEDVVMKIARASGVPARKLSVEGPPLVVDGVPDALTTQGAKDLPPGSYQVRVRRGDDLPLLTVLTQAPTVDAARRLADGTTTALSTLVEEAQSQSDVRESRLLTIRRLGSANANPAVASPSKPLAVAVFSVVLGIAFLLILVGPKFASEWRRSGAPLSGVPDDWAQSNGAANHTAGSEITAEELDLLPEFDWTGPDLAADDPMPSAGLKRQVER